jgi:hypothetical protein
VFLWVRLLKDEVLHAAAVPADGAAPEDPGGPGTPGPGTAAASASASEPAASEQAAPPPAGA